MRRFALVGLVLVAVFGLAVGGALAGEQRQTQQQEQAEPQSCNCYCDCDDCLCPGCDCPQECQQNWSGDGSSYDYEHLYFWEGPHEVPAEWQWLFGWGSE